MISHLLPICLVVFPVMLQAQIKNGSTFRERNKDDTISQFIETNNENPPDENEPTYSITITVTNIRNNNGVIRFKFYDESTPFPHKTGFLRVVVPKSNIKNGTFTATYHGFPAKKMGIALQDDENSDRKLDFGWFLPKEGHAFSDYYHTALRRPVFSDFSFMLSGDKHVTMKMRYY